VEKHEVQLFKAKAESIHVTEHKILKLKMAVKKKNNPAFQKRLEDSLRVHKTIRASLLEAYWRD
jgi:hypothetical protein